MTAIEMIRTYIKYSDEMTRKVWSRINELSNEQFIENLGYSHGSIRDLLIHMAVVDRRWLRGMQGQPDARGYTVDPADYPSRQSAFDFWDESAAELVNYVNSLDDEGLSRTQIGMLGPSWHVLLHLVNHATDHRSQLLRALTDFGVPTFDQDFILHQWFRE